MPSPDHERLPGPQPKRVARPRGLSRGLAIALMLLTVGCGKGARTDPRADGPLPTSTLPATLPLPGTAFPARGSALGCAARSVSEIVYEDPAGRFCLVQPAESGVFTATEPYPTVTFVYPPAPAGQTEPRTVYLALEDHGPVSGTLESAVDAELAAHAVELKGTLQREQATLSGAPAIIVDGLPGRLLSRGAYLVQGGRLYHVLVQPWQDAAMTDLQPKAEAMWKAMAETLTFAPE